MTSKRAAKFKDLPEVIVDQVSGRHFARGRFLGQGGFAICYELLETKTNEKFAGKIIRKSDLVKPAQIEKFKQEVDIHRTLNHKHVVGFHGFFEDKEYHYFLLDLCNRCSLMELHKRRKIVSEAEARYFVRQIVLGCQYLHSNRIVHRDLKLANLFLNDDMCVKIGDFGLATRIQFDEEKKTTLCGTPNYIAPEILFKHGHSYEVDSWSLGCILYTLLVGSPPFETRELQKTYQKIKQNVYNIPNHVSKAASNLITQLLNPNPGCRPNMFNILDHEFFKGYTPNCLPVSALTTEPRLQQDRRKPLSDVNPNAEISITSGGGGEIPTANVQPDDCWLNVLYTKVTQLVKDVKIIELSPGVDQGNEPYLQAMQDSEDPACIPIYWISKWVDYSDKYGLGYQLCDNSFGVVFNDVTRLLLTANEQNMQYIEKDGTEYLCTMDSYQSELNKKVTLLKYFITYMSEHLLMAGGNVNRQEADAMARLPFVRRWKRTKSAIVFHLSNGTLQINFLEDHAKLILCPLMRAVTYIDGSRDFKTYQFSYLKENGMIPVLAEKLRYALNMMERFASGPVSTINSAASSGPVKKTPDAATATTGMAVTTQKPAKSTTASAIPTIRPTTKKPAV